jgi:SM-20-related protein
VDPDVDEKIRKTKIHKIPEFMLEEYRSSFLRCQRSIEEYFSIALTTATEVQALEYTAGAFYIKHADDSNELVNDNGETVGFIQVAPLRKVTTVLFATSYAEDRGDATHFSGGELVFNYLFDSAGRQITLQPKAGDLVVFPSNPIYSHEVLPVKEGYRLTLVQWHNGITA